MRTLVTGAAGFLGSHLVDALVESGFEVVALDNLRRGRLEHIATHLHQGAIEFHRGDICNRDTLLAVLDRVDLIYHLAAQSNVMGALSDPDYSFNSNVFGTYNVLQAAAARNVQRVVFASSREVYGEPTHLPVKETFPLLVKNAYGASKMACEAYCRAWESTSAGDAIILRFANLYGPRDRDRVIPLWLDSAKRGKDLVLYGGKQVLDFVWVGTAVQALLAAAESRNPGAINIGTGVGTSLEDLAMRIVIGSGSRSKLTYEAARRAEVTRFIADNTLMRRVLGVVPDADPLCHLQDMMDPAVGALARAS